MGTFIKKSILFALPLIALFALMEFYLYYHPNSFNIKAKYVKENAGEIECLFLGTSHSDGNINPALISVPSANLAHAAQDYQLDSALFFRYMPSMPKLKYVFIEIDYHSLGHKNEADAPRVPWYYRYHDIQIYPVKFLHRISLFATSPAFFKNYLAEKLNPKSVKTQYNQYGFAENSFSGAFQELNYNEAEIMRTAPKRLSKTSEIIALKNFDFNRRKIQSVIDYCRANNIQVVLLKSPLYQSYRNNYDAQKLKLRDDFIAYQLQQNGNIILLDFEADEHFTADNFSNDDHLNAKGAEALSRMINIFLTDLEKQVAKP